MLWVRGCALIVGIAVLASSVLAELRNDEPPAWAVVFAQEFEQLVALGDLAAGERLFDKDALFERALGSMQVAPAEKSAMRDGWEGVKIFPQIVGAVAGGGSYRLLRVRMHGDEVSAVYRLITPAGAVNFHEVLLHRDQDDNARISDFFNGVTGEWMSSTSGRLLRLLRGSPGDREVLARLETFHWLAESEEYDAALSAWHSLPRRLRQEKGLLIQRIQVANNVSEAEALAAAEDLERLFPDDPACDLTLIDTWAHRGEYDHALEALQRVENWLGGDAYLDFLRGNLLYMAGRVDQAKQIWHMATTTESDLLAPRWSLVEVALEERDFATVAEQLLAIESLGIEIGDLAEAPIYAPFVESVEYAAWKTRRSYVRPLDHEERSLLVESRFIGIGVIAHYVGGRVTSDGVLSQIADSIVAWQSDEEEKLDPWTVVRGLGVLLGDHVARSPKVQWMIQFSPDAGEIAIIGDISGAATFDPFAAVASFLENPESATLHDVLSRFHQEVDEGAATSADLASPLSTE